MAEEHTITVKAGPKIDAGRVAIWDRDDQQPDGELYIVKAHDGEDDQAHDVAETVGVVQAIGDGRLVRTERRRAAPARQAPAPIQPPTTAGSGGVGDAIQGVTDAQRDALAKAGFHTPADIRAASDDQLAAVDGIGPTTVARLRETTKE